MTEEHDSIAPAGALQGLGLGAPAPAGANPMAAGATTATAPLAFPSGEPISGPPSAAVPLEQSVTRINARLAATGHVLVLRVDPQSGITIAEIKNASTGQVLQQVPSQDLVRLAELLASWAQGNGILIDRRA